MEHSSSPTEKTTTFKLNQPLSSLPTFGYTVTDIVECKDSKQPDRITGLSYKDEAAASLRTKGEKVYIRVEQAKQLAKWLEKQTQSLYHFDLGGQEIRGGILDITTALATHHHQLMLLNLRYNQIGNTGAIAIATHLLAEDQALATLELSYNSIGADGAIKIAEALHKNRTLHTLNVLGNQIGYAGTLAIANALRKNRTLLTLNLSDNAINDAAGQALENALQQNYTLTTLTLDKNNNILGATLRNIYRNLQRNQWLQRKLSDAVKEQRWDIVDTLLAYGVSSTLIVMPEREDRTEPSEQLWKELLQQAVGLGPTPPVIEQPTSPLSDKTKNTDTSKDRIKDTKEKERDREKKHVGRSPKSTEKPDPSKVLASADIDDTERKSSHTPAPAKIQVAQLKTKIQRGDVDGLVALIKSDSETSPLPKDVKQYLQTKVITDVLFDKHELKPTQKVQLIQVLTQQHGASVIQPNNDISNPKNYGFTPVDLAILDKQPVEVLQALQSAEVYETAQQDAQWLAQMQDSLALDLEETSSSSTALAEDKQVVKDELLDLLDAKRLGKQFYEIDKLCAKLVSPPATTTTQPSAASSTTTTSLWKFFTTRTTSSLVTTKLPTPPLLRSLEVQKEQIELCRLMLNVKLTKAFTKSLAIHYGLVDGHNQSRVGTVMTGIGFAASLIPLPFVGVFVNLLIGAGKYLAGKAAQKVVEKRDHKRYSKRLLNMTRLSEAGDLVERLAEELTCRYQLIIAQLSPESIEVFADCLVKRLVAYMDLLTDQQVQADLLKQRLVDLTQSPALDSTELPSDDFAAYFLANMNEVINLVMGTSLIITDSSKLSVYINRFIRGTDRIVTFYTAQGHTKTLLVREICSESQTITWLGTKQLVSNAPEYRYCDASTPESKTPAKPSASHIGLREIYLDRQEAALRKFAPTIIFTQILMILPTGLKQDPYQMLQLQYQALQAVCVKLREENTQLRLEMTGVRQVSVIPDTTPRLEVKSLSTTAPTHSETAPIIPHPQPVTTERRLSTDGLDVFGVFNQATESASSSASSASTAATTIVTTTPSTQSTTELTILS